MNEAEKDELVNKIKSLEALLTQASARIVTLEGVAARAVSADDDDDKAKYTELMTKLAAAGLKDKSNRLVDTKIPGGRPGKFNGKQEQWSDWSFVFKAYCGAISPTLSTLMDAAQIQTDPISLVSMSAEQKEMAEELYYILILLAESGALKMLKNCERRNGFEAWRLWTQEWEPKTSQRFAGLLTELLFGKFGPDTMASLQEWEGQIKTYEDQTKYNIPDYIKSGVLMGKITDDTLLTHLYLNQSRLSDYKTLRHEIVSFLQARKKWATGTAMGDAMDVDALQRDGGGKGDKKKWWERDKGKGGKGKGKRDKKKGKG